jgi:hypothetical protein
MPGYQVVKQVKGMDMDQIGFPDAFCQGPGQGPGGPPKTGRLNGIVANFHPILDERPLEGHRQLPRPILVGGVDLHLVPQAGHGPGHFHAGLGWASVARRQVGNDMKDSHLKSNIPVSLRFAVIDSQFLLSAVDFDFDFNFEL